jgi:HK97 family phage major capsid protein
MKVYNALQQDNPTQAGYLVPDEQFVMSIIKDLADICIIRKKATVYQLKNALSLGFPMRTAGMSSAAWGTEISQPTADTSLAYGKKELRPNPASSLILVSESLIRNSPVVEREVREAIVEDLDMLQETAFMTGDGAGKPLGIFTASVDGIPATRDVSTGNTATEIKFDGLMNAMFSVKGAARVGAEWLFHRSALLQLIKLKSSDGQYIWQPMVTQGIPGMLLGAPFNDSEYGPSTFTANQYVGIYGNLKNYLIADSLEMRFKVLGELYALTNQIGYITRIETDGCPVRPNAWARVKLGA